jgi:hypothetical protein
MLFWIVIGMRCSTIGILVAIIVLIMFGDVT